MDEVKFIWMDGKFVKWHKAQVHVLCHTLHYGAGAFEGQRFYETEKGAAIFRLPEHTDRLFKSAAAIHMKVPFTKDEINKATVELIRRNKIKQGYIRPLIYYGYGKMGLNPKGAPVNVSLAVWPWGSYLGDNPVRVKISSYIRIHPQSTRSDAKITGHYVNSILASVEAKEGGYDEALLLDYKGNIAEGPGENLFIVKDGKVVTPPLGNVLPGITRDTVFHLIGDLGIEYEERALSVDDLKNADEAFFTGSAAEVTPIAKVDDATIGSGSAGPVTMKIKDLYHDVIRGKVPKYEHWLTYV